MTVIANLMKPVVKRVVGRVFNNHELLKNDWMNSVAYLCTVVLGAKC